MSLPDQRTGTTGAIVLGRLRRKRPRFDTKNRQHTITECGGTLGSPRLNGGGTPFILKQITCSGAQRIRGNAGSDAFSRRSHQSAWLRSIRPPAQPAARGRSLIFRFNNMEPAPGTKVDAPSRKVLAARLTQRKNLYLGAPPEQWRTCTGAAAMAVRECGFTARWSS